MVVPDEMEQTVRKEVRHLRQQGMAPGSGLPGGCFQRDYDIPEKPRCVGGRDGCVHRKGQNVGRLVLLPVFPVELVDLRVARKEHAELGLAFTELGEHAVRAHAHGTYGDARPTLSRSLHD